jgi:hypothetical protein
VKDLEKIGRDLKRVIIVDNLKENYSWQKQNGIHIRTWYDDPEDTELQQLVPILRSIVTDGYDDVREALQNFRRQEVMGQIFPSIDGVPEESKGIENEDTIEQSMSHSDASPQRQDYSGNRP